MATDEQQQLDTLARDQRQGFADIVTAMTSLGAGMTGMSSDLKQMTTVLKMDIDARGSGTDSGGGWTTMLPIGALVVSMMSPVYFYVNGIGNASAKEAVASISRDEKTNSRIDEHAAYMREDDKRETVDSATGAAIKESLKVIETKLDTMDRLGLVRDHEIDKLRVTNTMLSERTAREDEKVKQLQGRVDLHTARQMLDLQRIEERVEKHDAHQPQREK
jgi:hypothetical protein